MKNYTTISLLSAAYKAFTKDFILFIFIFLFIAFIDYEKAFDLVETSAVIQALRNQGLDEPYMQLLQDSYSGVTGTIVLHKESIKIPIKKGVRQGYTISAMFPPLVYRKCSQALFWKVWE